MTHNYNQFENSTVLITGGTGSFGNAFLKRLLTTGVREIRIFSRDELKQELMRVGLLDDRVRFYIGDVRDRRSLDKAMIGVNFVFHAAALKQVPSCDFFPMQALQTNVIGSSNVIESAINNKVQKLVCLSTDKAVYPINAMGMTKALMEKVTIAAARTMQEGSILSTVRYGNVLYSRGSVIPLFIGQILSGKPLTVTVPNMTRFLLPLSEAIDLVIFAFNSANQGDIFIRKAPACTIEILAQALKNIFNSDVPINFIGMRHGEKLYETLATREELAKSEDLGNYFRVPMDDRDLNYGRYYTEGDKNEYLLDDYHSNNTEILNLPQVEKLLLTLPQVVNDLAKITVARKST